MTLTRQPARKHSYNGVLSQLGLKVKGKTVEKLIEQIRYQRVGCKTDLTYWKLHPQKPNINTCNLLVLERGKSGFSELKASCNWL